MTGQIETNLGEGGACEAFAAYVDLLGAEMAMGALHALETALRRVFIERQPADDGELSALADEAHRLISTASAVGFVDMARACCEFEESCGSSTARTAFERMRDVAVATLADIRRARAALQAHAPAGGANQGRHSERTGR